MLISSISAVEKAVQKIETQRLQIAYSRISVTRSRQVGGFWQSLCVGRNVNQTVHVFAADLSSQCICYPSITIAADAIVAQ